MGHEPVSNDLSTNLAHFPHGGLVIQWFHDRHLALGPQL